ncbi:hypothetical protein H0H12_05795 [Pseudomonas putida]|uniref:Uncharacterized protein n=1 Tax=Pseudomonas putida TaxID=303 RepID=A0A7D6A2Z0_PSEPU|nr:hypothetical protein [Pseudomonas putida]QLJ15460.1 hypothetical protein H0H12_05795 [Pseudomonas putida]
MSAKVSTRFEKRFELNEENIRRIHDDIRKRIPPEHRNDIIFEVFREDSLVFRTAEADRLLSENNDSTQKIKELKIEYKDDSLNITLEFDAEKGARLTIDGEDRDKVFLIASDLREYIQKEVCHIRNNIFSKKYLLLGSAVFLAVFLLAIRWLSQQGFDANIDQILASTDSNVKLNHLINLLTAKQATDDRAMTVALFPVFFMLIIFIPGEKIYNYFFPGNIFLIGKQISVITNRRGSIRNLFWGGIVALLIAFGSGYYFLWLSK